MRSVLATAWSVPFLACSIGALDGFSGGATTAAGPGPTDAAGLADADLRDDGGTEVPAPTCSARAFLCDDFERDDPLGVVWRVQVGSPRITRAAAGGTRALRVDIPAQGDAPLVARAWSSFGARVRLSFDVLAEQRNDAEIYQVLTLAYGPAYNWDTAGLILRSGGLEAFVQTFDESPSPTRTTAATVLGANDIYDGQWHRLVLRVDVSTATFSMAAEVDGAAKPSIEVQTRHAVPSAADLRLGFHYRTGAAPYGGFYFDNVVVEPD